MTDPSRLMALSQGFFSVRDQIPPERLASVEGAKPQGNIEVRRMMVGNEILMLHVFREKGLIDPVHKHMDHETVAYLIRGRLRLVIGGEEFIAEAGTSWIHPQGSTTSAKPWRIASSWRSSPHRAKLGKPCPEGHASSGVHQATGEGAHIVH